MSETEDRDQLGDAVAVALAHTLGAGLTPEDLAYVRARVVEGDPEKLRRAFITRSFAPLPDAKGLGDMRPTYALGAFPAQPPPRTPGGATKTLAQIITSVKERYELTETYGEEAIEAASPPSRQPVI